MRVTLSCEYAKWVLKEKGGWDYWEAVAIVRNLMELEKKTGKEIIFDLDTIKKCFVRFKNERQAIKKLRLRDIDRDWLKEHTVHKFGQKIVVKKYDLEQYDEDEYIMS